VTTAFSGHAQSVAARFYGNTVSGTPGITNIDAYLADHWLTSGFLTPDGPGAQMPQPSVSSSRVANHSYVGAGNSSFPTSNLLRRADWLVATDEYIHVIGFNGSSSPLFGSAFNTISVNDTESPSTAMAQNVDSLYNGSRVGVDLVAPESTPSDAAPRVASAAVLLVDAAHADPALSADPLINSMVNRNGDQVYNPERSEVVKALLMAGADRETNNAGAGDIIGYRQNAIDQTANGLDRRYGAGQVNIYNSYHILTGGEQNSLEDQPGGGGLIGDRGFDYDPAFGGLNASNNQGTYFFSTNTEPTEFSASLVWNVAIDGGSANNFDGSATLHDLQLYLYDVSDAQNWSLLASSQSAVDNTETIWTNLAVNTNYALQVRSAAAQPAFEWDYALAWQNLPITSTGGPDSDGDGIEDAADNCVDHPNGPLIPDAGGNVQLDTNGDGYGNACDADLDNIGPVNFADLALFKAAFGGNGPDADLDGNGFVNFADLARFKSLFGQPPGPSGLAP
jgi:hypothetical protein